MDTDMTAATLGEFIRRLMHEGRISAAQARGVLESCRVDLLLDALTPAQRAAGAQTIDRLGAVLEAIAAWDHAQGARTTDGSAPTNCTSATASGSS